MQSVIDKIFKEKTIIKNDFFHMVEDINPVCTNHFLLFPKKKTESFIDLGLQELLEFNKISNQLERHKNMVFFEKGRTSFCTSLDAPHYGHCHFVPLHLFKKNFLDKLMCKFKTEKFRTIEDVSNIYADSNYEYLMFGYLSGPIYFIKNITGIEKRFIRKFLSSNLIITETQR